MKSTELNGLSWHKSSYSGTQAACVEVARVPGTVAVRDSKDPAGPTLTVSSDSFAAFLRKLP